MHCGGELVEVFVFAGLDEERAIAGLATAGQTGQREPRSRAAFSLPLGRRAREVQSVLLLGAAGAGRGRRGAVGHLAQTGATGQARWAGEAEGGRNTCAVPSSVGLRVA